MKLSVLLFLLLATLLPNASASTVYSNTTLDKGLSIQYSTGGFDAAGDSITLAGTDRFATSATVVVFNVLPTPGTFDATLSLYSLGTSPNVLGNLITTSSVSGISISGYDINDLSSGLAPVTFNNLNASVPNSLIFLVTFSKTSNVDLGLELYTGGPTGSSLDTSFVAITGGLASNQLAVADEGNFYFSLEATASDPNAIPEPATLALSGLALAGLALLRRR